MTQELSRQALRAWSKSSAPDAPPTVIVQCKREQRKVTRVVVKALYADILSEKAKTGLIITTSDISPGAANDIKARAYPITTANRVEVERWIQQMRRPSNGIVLEFGKDEAVA